MPFLSLRLSSLWLFFVTNTSFPIARALVDSLTHETVCREDAITKLVPQALLTYRKPSKSLRANRSKSGSRPLGATPGLGAIIASTLEFDSRPRARCAARSAKQPLIEVGEAALDAIWMLGGQAGWPSMNWAWRLRGAIDRLFGGTGIRRGRRDPRLLSPGDVLDFWRVLLADRVAGRLILYAEMKVPGEAWLEFQVSERELVQTATFRPEDSTGERIGISAFLSTSCCFHKWRGSLQDRVKRDEELLAPEVGFLVRQSGFVSANCHDASRSTDRKRR